MTYRSWMHSKLRFAIIVSLFVHAFVISIQFNVLNPERQVKAPLEVILVNAQSDQEPDKAEVLAQVALDGGGQADEGRATTLPSVSDDATSQRELVAAQKKLAQLERLQNQLKQSGLQSNSSLQSQNNTLQEIAPSQSFDDHLGQDPKDQRALEIKRLQAQVANSIRAYNERPRKHFFSPRTSSYEFAIYEEAWRNRVEQIGNKNYPPELKGKIYGKLRMTVYLRASGAIDDIEIDQSSGSVILDRAAVRLLRLAAPFSPFTSEIREKAEILAITRTWVFTRDTLITQYE